MKNDIKETLEELDNCIGQMEETESVDGLNEIHNRAMNLISNALDIVNKEQVKITDIKNKNKDITNKVMKKIEKMKEITS